MEDRTINIIRITKRFGGLDTIKRAIAQYMSEECDTPVETYTEGILYSILKTAMFDFLHSATRRQDMIAFTRELVEDHFEGNKMIDRIIIAMSMIQVCKKEDWEYITMHGWHETPFTEKLDNEEWVLKREL